MGGDYDAVELLDAEIAADVEERDVLEDRIAAMSALRVVALDIKRSLRRSPTFEDIRSACETDDDVERLSELFARITASRDGSGSEEERERGYPLDRARADFGDWGDRP